MKVYIEIELDIPNIDDFSPEEVNQLVFDAYTNYVTCSHLVDSLKWCSKADTNDAAKHIFEYHNEWATIAQTAKVRRLL